MNAEREHESRREVDPQSIELSSKFFSRPNERIDLQDGRTIWHSRSMAVTSVVIALDESTGKRYFAAHKRGHAAPDHVGKLSLCSGYLDWDETLSQAAARETFEEIGLDLYALAANGYCEIPDQPYFIKSNPRGDARQNITARFLFELRVTTLPALNNSHCEPNESEEPRWLELNKENLANHIFAFNHEDILRDLCAQKGWKL